jgi:hypothetical protein
MDAHAVFQRVLQAQSDPVCYRHVDIVEKLVALVARFPGKVPIRVDTEAVDNRTGHIFLSGNRSQDPIQRRGQCTAQLRHHQIPVAHIVRVFQ